MRAGDIGGRPATGSPTTQSSPSGPHIHDNSKSHRIADVIGADAFTLNKQIYFGKGKYRPATRAGQRLLAHEIAHANQDLPADTIYMSPGNAKGARQKILDEARTSQIQAPSDAILNILDGLGRDELELLQSLLSSDLDDESANSSGILCHVVYIDIPKRLSGYASLDPFQHSSQKPVHEIQPQKAALCISKMTGNSTAEAQSALPMTSEENSAAIARDHQARAKLEQEQADERAKMQTAANAQARENAVKAQDEQGKFCTAQRNNAKGKPGSWEEQSYYKLVGDGTCPHPEDLEKAREFFGDAGKYLTEDNLQVEDVRVEPEEDRGKVGLRDNLFWRYASPEISLGIATLKIIGEASLKVNADFFGKDAWVTGGPKFGGVTSKGENGKREHAMGGRMEFLGNNLVEGETEIGGLKMKNNISAGLALIPGKAKPAFIASVGSAIGGEKGGGFGSITYIQPKTFEIRVGIKFKVPKDVLGYETKGDLAASGLALFIIDFDKSKAAELMAATAAGAAGAAAAAAASESAGAALRAELAQAEEEGIFDALMYGGGLAAIIALAPAAVPTIAAMVAEASPAAAATLAPAALAFLLDED